MPEFDNTNTGALFINNRKETANDPDRQGLLNVEGVEYHLNGWLKESKTGLKYLSLTVNKKVEQPQQNNPQPKGPGSAAKYGSANSGNKNWDVPF